MAPQIITTKDGVRRLELVETPSTNTECLTLARSGDPGNLWVTAQIQTKGRGSRGRSWETGEGNLFASLMLWPDLRQAQRSSLSQLTFVASLALLEAIHGVNSIEAPVTLKWPNDVLVRGKKCAGILLETHQIEDRLAVIIGFGVNCRWNPTGTPFPATNLQEEGIPVSAETLFSLLAATMQTTLSLWNHGRGFEVIRKNWLAHAYQLGESITIKIPGQEDKSGLFKSIDDQGLLVMLSENGEEQKLSTADIFPPART